MQDGDPGKRGYNRSEAEADAARLRLPRQLWGDKIAMQTWRRLSKILVQRRVLREEDSIQLGAICQAHSIYSEALAKYNQLEKGTRLLAKRGSGGLAVNPLLQIMYNQIQIIQRLGAEFGLSPVARARLDLDPEAGGSLPALDHLLDGDEAEPAAPVLQ